VATTGTIDPNDAAKLTFSGGVARLKSTTFVGTEAVIRYDLVLSPTLEPGTQQSLYGGTDRAPEMGVRFFDDGGASRVVVELKAYDVNTGVTTTVLRFDSDAYPGQNQFRTYWVFRGTTGTSRYWDWDFDNKNYFLEARLTKTDAGGNPGLGIIRLRTTTIYRLVW
jgi:hypothetical protein